MVQEYVDHTGKSLEDKTFYEDFIPPHSLIYVTREGDKWFGEQGTSTPNKYELKTYSSINFEKVANPQSKARGYTEKANFILERLPEQNPQSLDSGEPKECDYKMLEALLESPKLLEGLRKFYDSNA